jgi:chitinase
VGDPVTEQIQGKGYTFIKDSLVNQNEYYRYWDEAAQAPYLFNFYKAEFVTYDDEESVKAKCGYVKTNGMAGVMFWEYSSDPKEYLLNAINQVLK